MSVNVLDQNGIYRITHYIFEEKKHPKNCGEYFLFQR